MKKTFFTSLCLILTVLACSAQSVHTTTSFKGSQINGLIIGGTFDVQLSEGDQTGVIIEIREDATQKLAVTMTDDGYVRISFADDMTKYFIDNKRPLAKIVISKLKYLNLSGNVSLIAKGTFTCDQTLSIITTGGAFVDFLDVNCNSATVNTSGKSNIEGLTINAKENVDIETKESSKATIKVDCKKVTVSTFLATLVTISGKASVSAKLISSGTSKLGTLELTSPLIDAMATDMSRINTNVTDQGVLNKTGMAALRFIGSGKTTGKGAKPM